MPSIIASGATALEVLTDAIAANGHGTIGTSIFMGLEVDGPVDAAADSIIPAAVVIVTEGDGIPDFTFGTPIALENPTVQVLVRGDVGDYTGPKRKAMTIRYEIASLRDYTSRGLRVLNANPLGSVLPLGTDAEGRHRFTVNFNATTDPSYV